MRRYDVKYKKLVFLFGTTSFVAIFCAIVFGILGLNFHPVWWNHAGVAGIVFVIARFIGTALMSVRIENMTNPTISMPEKKRSDIEKLMSINPAHDELDHAIDLQGGRGKSKSRSMPAPPGKRDESATPETPAETASRKPASAAPPQATGDDNIPLLTEVVDETKSQPQPPAASKQKGRSKKQKPAASKQNARPDQQQAAATKQQPQSSPDQPVATADADKKVCRFRCSRMTYEPPERDDRSPRDKHDYDMICSIDTKHLALSEKDELGGTRTVRKVLRSQVREIRYEEMREVEYGHFRFMRYLIIGVIAGLMISVWLIGTRYSETGALPGATWAVTTMLPLLAVSAFGGLFLGLLIPSRKISVYAVFTVIPEKGKRFEFVTAWSDLIKVEAIMERCQMNLVEK